jgi:predicted DNA-binding ribbon-helix-helix protein
MGNCVPSKNVMVSGRRTSMRMEEEFWRALDEMARRENKALSELLTQIDNLRGDVSLTAKARLIALDYFCKASTDDGHRLAGHGSLRPINYRHCSDDILQSNENM